MNILEESERIKDRIRGAGSVFKVGEICDQERAALEALEQMEGGAVLGRQIRDLKNWKIKIDLAR